MIRVRSAQACVVVAGICLVPAIVRADDGSVQVRTVVPERGTAPDLVRAFGSAGPALGGGMTISLQQDGRVLAIDVTPGEAVHAGQGLIEFGASAASSSTFEQARTALDLAQSERKHVAQLLSERLATRDQLAQADKAVSDARSTLDALTHEGFGHATRTLAAPFDGIVATVPIATGDHVQPGTPLVTLTRLDGLVVTVGLEPADHDRVHAGAPAHLEPLAGGHPVDGHVIRVDGVLNPRTRLIDADIAVPVGSVISGATFAASVTVGELAGWKVPHGAVLIDGTGAYLFQVGDGKQAGHAVRVDVAVLDEAGPYDMVSGPLVPGRRLVVEGNYQLDDGAALREAAP
jgi:membrane fusion protein (multidrug efflux system)